MTTSTPSSSSSSSNKTSARSFMARTGFLVAVVCAAAAAVGGGLATLVLMKNTNSQSRSPDEGGGAHPREEEAAAALQHRLAVVETQLAEVTATVALLTTTIGTGTGTDPVRSSNRRLQSDEIELEASWMLLNEAPTPNRNVISSKERVEAFLNGQYDVLNGPLVILDNVKFPKVLDFSNRGVEATPSPDNDLVCTPFRVWLLQMIWRYDAEDNRVYPVDTNRTIYVDNAVGATEKKTMYKPTAQNPRLCNGDDQIVCPTPTEELGIFAGNFVYDAAGPTLADDYSSWRNYMVLLDPVVIDGDNGPLTQYRSSFAYTEYYYEGGGDAYSPGKERVPEFPITGGTGRFGSASGSVKTTGYVDIKNEDTGYYEDFIELQFNVCVPPPKNTNPAPPGPPKKSGKAPKASF